MYEVNCTFNLVTSSKQVLAAIMERGRPLPPFPPPPKRWGEGYIIAAIQVHVYIVTVFIVFTRAQTARTPSDFKTVSL